MDNFVITIGREFGSGGKYIGEELAKRLHIKCYDKELLQVVSEKENVDIHLLEKTDETNKGSFWYTMASASFLASDSVNSFSALPMNEQIFLKETKVIQELAKKESCVIIGRCSNIILKYEPNVKNIFVYASNMDFKIKRKVEFAGLSAKEASKAIMKKDKERATYYNYFTNEKWGAKEGYDLLIDTSKIGVENAINLIETYIKM